MSEQNPYDSQHPPYQPPQQPSGYGASHYGAPQYGAYQPLPEHPQATLIMVLGIVSIFVGVVGPVAWVMGSRAKKEIEASGGQLGGLQQVTVGWILGIITSVLLVLAIVAFLVIAVTVLGVFAAAS